jgi:ATP-dependent DNA helicase RecQ
MTQALDEARRVLSRVFGYADFKPGQAEILDAVLAGEDVLAVMPTGSGKSLCYQLPALVDGGLTLVVSPLIALMRDQVQQLRALGVRVGALNSSNDGEENAAVLRQLREGRLSLLYVAPERLARPDTQALLRAARPRRIAIDEAHCVSQWGHDFRPDYLGLREAAAAIGDMQTLAVTATADAPTRADIVTRLFDREPRVFLRSFDRPNLHLAMARRTNRLGQIMDFLAAHKGESGIVYCASRAGVERLAAALSERGLWALPYHAGLEPGLRASNQDEFLRADGVVMVATVAFGMGVDKPDVRFVVHADLPQSIEAYYQEIGRAGRDGLPADTLCLYAEADAVLRRRQIRESGAPRERQWMELKKLEALEALCETPRCRRQTLLAAFGEASKPCGHCDICDGGFRFYDAAVTAQKAMSAILRTSGRFMAGHLANLLSGKSTDAIVEHGHDELKTFGVGAEFTPAQWRSVFRQLQGAELIARDEADRDRWLLTEAGRDVLAGRAPLQLRVEDVPRRRRRAFDALRAVEDQSQDLDDGVPFAPAAGPRKADGGALTVAQASLFAALKAHRMELAKANRAPAYTIFADRSLIDMAERMPRDLREFAEAHGVGEAKLARYGESFLAVIARHRG